MLQIEICRAERIVLLLIKYYALRSLFPTQNIKFNILTSWIRLIIFKLKILLFKEHSISRKNLISNL